MKRSNEEYSTKKKKRRKNRNTITTRSSVKGYELHKQCAVMNFNSIHRIYSRGMFRPAFYLSAWNSGFFLVVWCCLLFSRWPVSCVFRYHFQWKWIIMSRIHMKSHQISFWIWHHFKCTYAAENICSIRNLIHKKLISVCHKCSALRQYIARGLSMIFVNFRHWNNQTNILNSIHLRFRLLLASLIKHNFHILSLAAFKMLVFNYKHSSTFADVLGNI